MNKTILIADDHGIVRMGLTMMIRKFEPQSDIYESKNYSEVIEMVKSRFFDLYILDVSMPNGNFLTTFNYIKHHQPKAKVLIFSSLDERLYAMRYIQEGADGFLNKLAGEDEIKRALEKIFSNGKYVSDAVKDSLVFNGQNKNNALKSKLDHLSNREIAIANMLIKGDSLKHISEELNIHVSTVSTYKTRIFEKLDINSVPELMRVFDLNDLN